MEKVRIFEYALGAAGLFLGLIQYFLSHLVRNVQRDSDRTEKRVDALWEDFNTCRTTDCEHKRQVLKDELRKNCVRHKDDLE